MIDLFFKCSECSCKSHQLNADGDVICLECKLITPVINDCVIIKKHDTPAAPPFRAGRVILADRGAQHVGCRWVTAWQGRDLEGPDSGWDKEWSHGHYHEDIALAEADFHMRAVRGF